jgi:hypothetical protein
LTLIKNGASVIFPAVVTMIAGAVPQQVTLTAPNPKPSQITITPTSAPCTPNAVSPYTCTINFSYKAGNGSTQTYTAQKVTGVPSSVSATSFSIIVQ